MLTVCVLTAGLSGLVPQSPPPGTSPVMPAEDRVIRVISIRRLLGTARAPQPPRLGTLLRSHTPALSELESWEGKRSLVEPWSYVRFLETRLLPDGIRTAPDVDISQYGSNLAISGPPEVVEEIVQAARSAAAALIRDVEIEAALYPAPARDLPVVASAAELAEITKDLRPVWRARAVTRAGNPVGLASERLTPYLADVQVEVASRAQIGDPEMWTLFEGVRLVVQPHVLASSRDMVLMCQVAVGERRGELRTIASGVHGLPTLDVPDLDVLFGTFSGRVPDGGALLLSCRGARELGGSFLLVVSARQRNAPPPATEGLVYLPITAFYNGSLRREPRVVGADGREGSPTPLLTFDAESPDEPYQIDLIEVLKKLIGDDDRTRSSVHTIGGHLVVRARPEFVRAAATMVAELEDRSLRTVAVSASSVREVAGRAEVVQRLDLPALLDRPHAMVCGRETTALMDFEVEVAQRSSISDPVVRRLFAGLLVTAKVHDEEGFRGLRAEVVAAALGDPRRRPTGAKGGGELFVVQTANAHHVYDGPLDDGEIDLGQGPSFEGTPTRQVLRATPLR